MLNVSANTIRRFAEKGFLSPQRNDGNQYRYFENSDVEKIAYISKYRKIGFGHEEIADIFESDLMGSCDIYEAKMNEIEQEIFRLTSLRHMLKDDIGLMKRSRDYGDVFQEKECVALQYVSYKEDKKMRNQKAITEEVHRFLYEFPEIKYIYIIRKEDILSRKMHYEEAIAIRTNLAEFLNIDVEREVIESYPRQFSIMRVIRLPMDFMNESTGRTEEIKTILYDNFISYMKEKGYTLAGDAVGVKIGYSKEQGEEVQYVLFSMPVHKDLQ